MAQSIGSGETLRVELTAADIPGANQDEPLEHHGVPVLKWWLLVEILRFQAHGRRARSSSGRRTARTWKMNLLVIYCFGH